MDEECTEFIYNSQLNFNLVGRCLELLVIASGMCYLIKAVKRQTFSGNWKCVGGKQ